MTGDPKDARESLSRLALAIIDDILEASDEEIISEVVEEGFSPTDEVKLGRALAETALQQHAKSRLAAAKEAVHAYRLSSPVSPRPLDVSQARRRFHELWEEANQSVSIAARKANILSDKDLADILSDLDFLKEGTSSFGETGCKDAELDRAELILKDLGVTEPKDIDLEAIAHCMGARVNYKPLNGCEARIVGNKSEAIITVNSRSSATRQRFSLAHELGHWACHRGQVLLCSNDDIGRNDWLSNSPERIADRFAANLVMPWYLFLPLAKQINRLTFQAIRSISSTFRVSNEAAAIRLIDSRQYPAILICHGTSGRRWFHRSSLVPERWFPKSELAAHSSAFEILFGRASDDVLPRKVNADTWFDKAEARYHEVQEQSIRLGDDRCLTLIYMDKEMLKGR